MLRSASKLKNFRILASDGEVGKVKDIYFDDQSWTVRYFIVDTGTWLKSRQVLVSPVAVSQARWEQQALDVTLTRQQVHNSPGIDADKPVSRQQETSLVQYYGWPMYWEGYFAAYPPVGMAMPLQPAMPGMGPATIAAETAVVQRQQKGDPHLRSQRELVGYDIHAINGDAGHVDDMLVEDGQWIMRYIVVDTRNWLPGRRVLISPQWVLSVDWLRRKVGVDLLKKEIKQAPVFDPTQEVTRQYEDAVFEYYGRDKYWL